MTEETKQDTLAELKKKVAELEKELSAKDTQIDEMKKKEEGWLVWTSNPTYNGTTMGIQFTDGMAFIPVNREIPAMKIDPMNDSQIRASAEALRITEKELKLRIEESSKIPTSRKAVARLVSDFGYQAQYFTKDEMDGLQKRMSDRARERADVEAKMGTQAEMLEKLLVAHRM